MCLPVGCAVYIGFFYVWFVNITVAILLFIYMMYITNFTVFFFIQDQGQNI
jgi:hypothetical protein